MTKHEFKSLTSRFSKMQWPNWSLVALGAAALAYGIHSPEQSEAIIGGLVSLFLGWAKAQHNGIVSKLDKQQEATQQTVADTPENTATMLAPVIGEAIKGLRDDMDAKHAENKADRMANEAAHQEHRAAIAELREGHKSLADGQDKLSQQMGEMAERVGEIAGAMGGRIDGRGR